MIVTVGIEDNLSEWLEDTPDEMPDVECLETLEMFEKALWQDCKEVIDPR